MIDELMGLPDGVAGFVAHGRLTRQDYESVLVPKMHALFAAHPKVRCYYELGPAFQGMDAGAMWEDFKLGVEHPLRWERVAVVSDVEWIRAAMNLFRFVVPGDIRIFPVSEAEAARAWIVEGLSPAAPAQ